MLAQVELVDTLLLHHYHIEVQALVLDTAQLVQAEVVVVEATLATLVVAVVDLV